MTAYTGALTRSAHYAFRPPVPGIDPEHEHPSPEPDPFDPKPEGAGTGVSGDVWQPEDLPQHSEWVVGPRPHDTPLQPPVPSNVHQAQANLAATSRMLANHSVVEFRPDTLVPYKVATQGATIDWYTGRAPRDAGITVPDDASFLVAGKNAFDFTNPANEVYAGAPANVGRYRLQENQQQWGEYRFWTKQGQDAQLRAYTGLSPQFPQDKPRVENSAPYVRNSSGTTRWLQSQWQVPSIFGLPSETASTDYMATATGAIDTTAGDSGFDDGGRL